MNIQSHKKCTKAWGDVFSYANQVCTFDPTGKAACQVYNSFYLYDFFQ